MSGDPVLFERAMMAGRAVPDDLDRPDRQFRYIRIQMEQVDGFRRAGDRSAGFAYSLSHVAESLAELGWHDLARLVKSEEVEVWRALPGDHGDALCRALDELRDTLVRLELFAEARPVADELCRLLADRPEDPSRPSPGLARLRHVQILTSLGLHHEAAEAAGEAVAWTRRQPATGKAGQTGSYALAYALWEHAGRLARIGRYEDALAAHTEATRLWRDLDGEPFQLTTAVNAAARWLAGLGRDEEAYESTAAMTAVLREACGPDRHGRKTLAAALCNFGGVLIGLGRDREALAVTEESVRRFRAVVAGARRDPVPPGDPGRWTAELRELDLSRCVALINRASILIAVGRYEEALAVATEAVRIARDRGAGSLVPALNNRSVALNRLGRYRESAGNAEEAVALARDRARADPDNDVALTHGTLCVSLSELGRHDEALAASLTAVAGFRALHALEPPAYEGRLADALVDHGVVRSRRSEHAEATAAVDEAVRRYRELVARLPGRYSDEYFRAEAEATRIRAAAG